MEPMNERIERFLSQSNIAVVGVSKTRETPANAIFRKLVAAGRTPVPVSPHLDSFEGARCYRSISAIDEAVNAAILVTRPEITEAVVAECIERGVGYVWMHAALGTDVRLGKGIDAASTSVSAAAVARCREAGITVIPGSCPMQFIEPVDLPHRCIRGFARAVGNLS